MHHMLKPCKVAQGTMQEAEGSFCVPVLSDLSAEQTIQKSRPDSE